ncbi:isochorismatase [Streptomyces sp. AS58]|uniref:Isochorismatase family protein n=1 Tax=Streptomyces cadmiisoli TaxID=2184053 RepID=A0A2Z4J7Z9_9ACTN|nr:MULTISPECIES: isochorismatase family protein [Streptomyces]AWW41057.1 isochorismatase family protein [Streptomyces cadmiisoli]KOV53858.1 isochorismatase [Streptomyces sp. AS58]
MGIPPIAPYPMPTASELPKNRVDWLPDPDRCVLFLHDMQAYFLAAYDTDSAPYGELLANTRALRERAVALGMPVVYSAQPGDMDREQRGLLHDFWGPGMSARAHDTAIVEELRPADGDLVLTKWRYSAFVRSELRDVIRNSGRDQLIIGGVYAHVGCLMTAVDAFSLDIEPFLVADAVADFTAEHHGSALDYAAQCCAAVLTTAQVLDHLTVPFKG